MAEKQKHKVVSLYMSNEIANALDKDVKKLKESDTEMKVNRNKLVDYILRKHYFEQKGKVFMSKSNEPLKFNMINKSVTLPFYETPTGGFLSVHQSMIDEVNFTVDKSTGSYFASDINTYYLEESVAEDFVKELRVNGYNVNFDNKKTEHLTFQSRTSTMKKLKQS